MTIIVRKIWVITCLSAALLMSDVSLGAEESLTYDVDGDGVQSSFTDGILIYRYLFGFSGNALISGVVDDGATRATAESIEAYIAGLDAQLDLDGDGRALPLTDGLLLIRAMAGACGESEAVSSSAPRTTCTDILSFANLAFPKLSDLGFGSNKENELTLSVSQQTDNPSRLNFRYSYQGEESLLGFAIWIFYDSTQATNIGLFESEQAATSISFPAGSELTISSSEFNASSQGIFRNNLDSSNLDDDVSTDRYLAYLYFSGEATVEQQSEALWSESFAVDFGPSITTTSVLPKVVSVSSNVSVSQPNAVEISRLDTDLDGVIDYFDAFPLDATETVDTDSDGTGNNADTDDDNDGVLDTADAFALFSLGSLTDTDGDGRPNDCDSGCTTLGMIADTDDDADGVADGSDAFPLDSSESVDTDSDGTGNNADTDDDGDGVADASDAFPLDANETVDTDSDGTGNNADTDDDGDGVLDWDDAYPLISLGGLLDSDLDGYPNECADDCVATVMIADADDDNDGVADIDDFFPLDASESSDADGDGVGDNKDSCLVIVNPNQLDTDSDGYGDACDPYPEDPTLWSMKIEDALAAIEDSNLKQCIEFPRNYFFRGDGSQREGNQVALITEVQCQPPVSSLAGLENFSELGALYIDTLTIDAETQYCGKSLS